MRNTIFLRALSGALIGICLSQIIALFISFCIGDGSFIPCAPICIDRFGSELSGVTIQFFLSGLLGAVFGGASVIWDVDHWSILRATATHFLTTGIIFIPVSLLLGWCEPNLTGVVYYTGFYGGIYLCIWIGSYLSYRHRIRKINEALDDASQSDS